MRRPLAMVVGAVVLGFLALTPTVSSADPSPGPAGDHGTRIVGERGVQRTTAELAAASHGRTHDAWPARGSGVAKAPSPDALRSRAPKLRDTGPNVAVTNPLTFDGPSVESGITPPDTQGDIGPTQFFVTINTRFKTFTRAGAADGVVDMTPDDFFASEMTPAGCNFTSDPHVRYDRLSQRWFVVMIDVPGCNGDVANRVMIAVSDGPTITPSTTWTFFHVNAPVLTFADYPTLGIDSNALYIGVNDFSTLGPFTDTAGYVVRKSSILGTGPIVSTRFSLATGSGAGPFTPQGVDDPYAVDAHGYFVGVDNAEFSKLDLVTVTDPGGSPTIVTTPLNVPATAYPTPVAHLGNTGGTNGRLDAVDDRLFAATMTADGHIWTAHAIGTDASGVATGAPTRDASRWYEITTAPGLVQSGTIVDGAATNPVSYWIPTVAVSGQGIMAIGGSAAGAGTHADAWYAARLPTDPVGATDAPTRYTSSAFAYNPAFDSGGNSGRRWGDYSLTRVDPNDNQTLWTIQEYVNATNSWGVKIAKLRAPGPATPTGASAPVSTGQASVHVTLSGTSAGGTGWYDPGAGFPQHLSVSVGCGVQVNAVQVLSPTSLDVDLDTTGASAGSCSVTTTNPDGQQATGSDVLVVEGAGPSYQPDGLIRKSGSSFVGDDVYNTTGTGQTVKATAKRTKKAVFSIQVQNDGTDTDSFVLDGPGGQPGFAVTYLAGSSGSTAITSQVTQGTYTLADLAPGEAGVIRLKVKVKSGASIGAVRSWLVTATSGHDGTRTDAVRAKVKVVRH